MLLDDIGTRLVNQNVVSGATGWTLFKGTLPNDPDQSVALFEAGGNEPDQYNDNDPIGEVDLSVIVRGSPFGYQSARNKAQDVVNALNQASIANYTFIFMKNPPLSLGNDENERPELSINFRIRTSV